jgi:hypothetical protein
MVIDSVTKNVQRLLESKKEKQLAFRKIHVNSSHVTLFASYVGLQQRIGKIEIDRSIPGRSNILLLRGNI